MDNIITLIVIFIVLGSMIRKLKARQKAKQGATSKGANWITKLNAFLADIQRQIEQQSKGRSSGASGWDHLLDGGEPYRSQPDADEAALDDRVFEEVPTQPRPKKMPPAAPVRAQTSRSDKVPGVTRRRAVHAGQPSCAPMAVSRAGLRQAVIWAEILGPPVALRDGRGNGPG
jgi:hypothetical protein